MSARQISFVTVKGSSVCPATTNKEFVQTNRVFTTYSLCQCSRHLVCGSPQTFSLRAFAVKCSARRTQQRLPRPTAFSQSHIIHSL